MNRHRSIFGALAAVAGIVFMSALLHAQEKIDPDADRILKSASKYLADAKSFSVKAEVWKDQELASGVKVQTTRALEVHQRRPDQLHIEVRSPRISQGFWYGDKTLTMLDRRTNLYGVMEVPETIDKTIDAVEERFGIEIPVCDLLVSDPYRNVMENVDSGAYLGKATVLGVECHHLLFSGANADCQVWIADGARPLPRKIVFNFKSDVGPSQVTQIFSDWDLVTPIADSIFTFVPPEGAAKIVVNPKKDEPAKSPTASTDAPAQK